MISTRMFLGIVVLVTSVVSANCHQSRDTYAPCNSLQDRGTCLRSLESRTDVPDGIQILGNRCVWCQNGPCTGLNQNRCEPKEWLDTKQHSGYEDTSPCECTVKYTRHRSMLRLGNWVLKNEDLITTDPECLRNPWCRAPQGHHIGVDGLTLDRCKVACAAHPQCKTIAIGYPGSYDLCYLGGDVNDQDNPLYAHHRWDMYDIEEVCEPVTTQTPTMQPSSIPTLNPTSSPSLNPTSSPTSNPTSSPTSKPTTNPSKRPTAEDFIVKVKAFHGEPKDVLDASKLQDQPDVDAEFFGFEHKLTPFTRRLLKVFGLEEQEFGREEEQEFA